MHGLLAPAGCKTPNCIASCEEEARPGYESVEASEYLDDRATLKIKVARLAKMIRASKKCVFYTGAGISTASGTPDYASKVF